MSSRAGMVQSVQWPGYGAGEWKNRNSVRGTARNDFVSTERPDRSGAHSAGTSRGVKRPGREFENLARHLALVKNKHLCSNTHLHGVVLNQRVFLTFWCRSYFLILAHPVYKYHGWALTVFSLTQHNTRHTPIVRHILSTALLTQYDMLPQHQVNI